MNCFPAGFAGGEICLSGPLAYYWTRPHMIGTRCEVVNQMDGRKPWEQAASVLPGPLRSSLCALGADRLERLEELRLRRGFPMAAVLPEGEVEADALPVDGEALRQVVENATQSSAHTALDKVCQGFFTLRGGHRMGLCGTVVKKDGRITALRELSSLSIRVARPVAGIAGPVLPELTQEGRFLSTLILAPPGAGKTTFLRDLVRTLSDGEGCLPHRVSVADERGEVAALWRGEPQLYVGRRTDVLDGCAKAEGLSILIRGMNPQVAAVDEVARPGDARAVMEAAGCGAAVAATAHGAGVDGLRRRPALRALLEAGVFRRLAVVERRGGRRSIRVEVLP